MWFMIGLFIGSFLGVLIGGACCAAGSYDYDMEMGRKLRQLGLTDDQIDSLYDDPMLNTPVIAEGRA